MNTDTSKRSQRRVVCAALYDLELDMCVLGARHCDMSMHYTICAMPNDIRDQLRHGEQGFIDQWGKFMNRKEAFEVATAAGQIIQKTGNPDSKELFSEDIY
jgi:hypothetical protein